MAPPAVTPLGGERRRVTILFADLVGFATVAEHLDPEELRTLITEVFGDLTAEVEAREGRVEKFIGDAVMAMFGASVAHEDDPERAVEVALRMMGVVSHRSEGIPTPLQLRIGINSGLVISGRVGDGSQTGVMGDAVNVAARLQQAAAPGEVLVTAPVWRRIRDRYDAQEVGLLEVKGREQRVEAYRIVGLQQSPGRRQSPFIGRSEELTLLNLLWSSALKGNTHVISLVGEPGVGKSRLISECRPRQDGLDIRIRCGSERAFGPFLDLIERLLGGVPADLRDLRRRTAAAGVEEEVAPLLATILGMAEAPPAVAMADEQQKRQVFSGVWQLLLGILERTPALVVFDDLHWADRSSLELMAFLLERLGGVPLTVVLAYRPGFDRIERIAMRASHTGIRLELLSWKESLSLARGFLGVSDLPPDLERILTTRAEGNPFFIEELLQALLELGSLAVVEGEAVLAKVDVEIPDTVQGTILARIDRMQADQRAVVQQAAVIGRRFSTRLIEAVMGEDVTDALEALARAQLLVLQGPGEWAFRHALIQEVAYETMLLGQRRELHRQVAEAIEAEFDGDVAYLELLAEHFSRAEVPQKAQRYAVAAADAAAERMGFAEARDLYQRALQLWGDGDDDGRLALLMKLGWSAMLAADAAAAKTALVEAEEGWRGLGNQQQAGLATAMLGRVYFYAGETERSAQVLDEAIRILEADGPSPELLRAHTWISVVNIAAGRVEEGLRLATQGLELAEEMGLEDARANLQTSVGSLMVLGGDPSGIDAMGRGLALSEGAGDVEGIGRAYLNLAIGLFELSRNREGLDLCRQGRAAMRKLGAKTFEWALAAKEVEILTDLALYEDALDLADEALGSQRPLMIAPAVAWAGCGRAQTLLRRGRYEEARHQLDEILPIARRMAGSLFMSDAFVAEAELEEARGNMAAARQALTEAVDVVLAGSSVVDVARTVVPAARLLAPERARELVALMVRLGSEPLDVSFVARIREAEGIMDADADALREATDLYASLDLAYQEARAALASGDAQRASAIVQRLGLEAGPLGPGAAGEAS